VSGAWGVEAHQGSAAEFHARSVDEPARRAVWWSIVDRPALVLGSAQRPEAADAAALAGAGVELVRRRSGGGAVLLVPGEVVWADLIVPAGDALWDDDVGRAAHWLGDAWARALAGCGLTDLAVHRGPMVRTAWSSLVCFSGLGPGEVHAGGRKVVGISQRRTRGWVRLQSAAYLRWDPAALVALLAEPRPPVDALTDAVLAVPATADAVRTALDVALP
jgi:lipoate-protein ligase A